MNILHSETKNGLTLTIVNDECCDSPREEGSGNLGTIYANSSRHNYDGHDIEEILKDTRCLSIKDNIKSGYIYLPVYFYEHSGLTIWTSKEKRVCPDYQWDGGLLGVIAVSKKRALKEVAWRGWKKLTTKRIEYIKDILNGEIQILDDWLQGNCYGYMVEDEKGQTIDSCFGYIGEAGYKDCLADGRDYLNI